MKDSIRTENDVIQALSSLVQKETGVQLGEKQRVMVESRIRRRARELRLTDLKEYWKHFESNTRSETSQLISLLTTHHTYFFREFSHFEFLENTVLPSLIPIVRQRGDRRIRILSAACSRGQEVYSLAMAIDSYLTRHAPDLKFEILGTDIDEESIEIAKNGVYRFSEIKEIPANYLAGYWVRGKEDISDFAKIRENLRSRCDFRVMNLIDPNAIRKLPSFDVIFCRNVFIYFTPEQVKSISTGLFERLYAHGHFFVGLSESLHGLGLSSKGVGPSIYQHANAVKPAPATPIRAVRASPPLPSPIRILCVDDSPTVLSLLKKVFTRSAGFEVVGTAENGVEAARQVKLLKPDAVTLDIHMPERNGIEYLEREMGPTHPPVLMISSVSRENAELASRALELGASDYIEKPTLNQLTTRSEEIQTKVRAALMAKAIGKPVSRSSIDSEFSQRPRIQNPEKTIRVVYGSLGDRERMAMTLKDAFSHSSPGVLLLLENPGSALPEIASAFCRSFKREVRAINEAKLPAPGEILLADFITLGSDLRKLAEGKQYAVLSYGYPSKKAESDIMAWKDAFILIEEGSSLSQKTNITDVFPATSFVAISDERFSGIVKTKEAA